MKSLLLRLCAVAVGAVLLTSAYYRTSSASVMTEAANRFLASLTAEQGAKATFQYAAAARNGSLPAPSRQRPAERRTEPGRIHPGSHHHESGRRPAHHGEGFRRAAQPRKILLLHLRRPQR